jgi:cytochrome oxidase Cu insertion factor (SCO1/SenC/PrrC family)
MQSLNKFVQRSFLAGRNVMFLRTAAFSHHHTADPFENNAFPYAVKARVSFPAPHFEGQSWYQNTFKKISLTDYKGKYVVLFFYPLDFTFVCPTEIKAFDELAEEFRKISKSYK